MIRLSGLALSFTMTVTPAYAYAYAYTYIELGNGRYLQLPDRPVLLALLLVLGAGALLVALFQLVTYPRTYYQVPQQVIYPDTAEHYEKEAARLRALKHKLDAETELTESYIKAERAKAEAQELSEILAHDKSMRRGAGGNNG
jgi:hypothetical protein